MSETKTWDRKWDRENQGKEKYRRYRSRLNRHNRKKGTYGNGDGKDASHEGGRITAMVDESTNRGRSEKSRLKGSKRA